jgi:hypothetical protein
VSAFIKSLQRSLEAEVTSQQLSKTDLKQRFIEWYESTPEVSRVRPYSMIELERALSTQGRFLSPILLSLGWERRRKWSSNAQSPRYWVPPELER